MPVGWVEKLREVGEEPGAFNWYGGPREWVSVHSPLDSFSIVSDCFQRCTELVGYRRAWEQSGTCIFQSMMHGMEVHGSSLPSDNSPAVWLGKIR